MPETKHCPEFKCRLYILLAQSQFSYWYSWKTYPFHTIAMSIKLKSVCANLTPQINVGYLLLSSDLCVRNIDLVTVSRIGGSGERPGARTLV